MHVKVEGKICAANMFAEPAMFFGLQDRSLQSIGLRHIFAADINKSFMRADSITSQGDAFQQLVGVRIDQHAVFEDQRLAFVRIADNVLSYANRLRDEPPLAPDRKTCAAAALQTRSLDFLNER